MNEVASVMINSGAAVPVSVNTGVGNKQTAVSATADEWFVINLCASMTPMPAVPKFLQGFEEFKLFEVSRVEDGRRRYRLRLGFFNCEAEAELLLSSIRNMYPAAFASAAAQEDLRYLSDANVAARPAPSKPVAAATPTPESQPAPKQSAPLANAAPAPVIAAANAVAAPVKPQAKPQAKSQPVKSAESVAVKAQPSEDEEATRIMRQPLRVSAEGKATALKADAKALDTSEMSLEFAPTPEPGVPTAATSAGGEVTTLENKPFHVGRGVVVPEVALELAPERKPAPRAAAASTKVTEPKAVESKATPKANTTAAPAATKPAAPPASKPVASTTAAPPVKTATSSPVAASTSSLSVNTTKQINVPPVVDDYVPILDTTLTIRTLTQSEKDDPNQPKWFAVELASSEHPFNLEAMPRLDIFAAYRLYSVVVGETGKMHHALRLGFFKEEVSAAAVSGYLKTFFPSPVITRIGVAEYSRFAEPRPTAPVADTNVVKLVEKRDHAPASPTQDKPAATTPNKVAGKPLVRGDGSKLPQAAINKQPNKASSDSGIRQIARPQSFFARLIGRDLD